MILWLTFYFAFRSNRQAMWRHCAFMGVIAGIVSASFDYYSIHSEWNQKLHPEYAILVNNIGLMATAMLLDFVLYVSGALGICWFGWLCRWAFVWSK
jgi:hypothetical protein